MPRSWKTLVELGRVAALKGNNARWTLGDLALEAVPMGAHGGNRRSEQGDTRTLEKLARYATEVGVEVETLDSYRKVASAWPEDTRVASASWSAHREALTLAGSRDEAHRVLAGVRGERVTVDAVRAAFGRASSHGGAPVRSLAEKTERVREWLRDPVVGPAIADAVVSDNTTGAELGRAQDRVRQRQEKETRDRIDRKKTPEQIRDGKVIDLGYRLTEAKRRVRDALALAREVAPFSRYEVEELLDQLATLERETGWLHVLIEEGTKSLDQQLAELLQEGS